MMFYSTIRDNPPCKDCTYRHIACHCSCDRYKEWKVQLDELNQARKEYERIHYNKYPGA